MVFSFSGSMLIYQRVYIIYIKLVGEFHIHRGYISYIYIYILYMYIWLVVWNMIFIWRGNHRFHLLQWPFQDPRLEVPTIYKA